MLLRSLPFNSRASFLWWCYVPGARESLLVGDAVIVGWPDADGESTDVPEAVLRLLTESVEYGITVRLDNAPGRDMHPLSRLAQIVLPLTAGDPSLLMSSASFASYFDALAWAWCLNSDGRSSRRSRSCLSWTDGRVQGCDPSPSRLTETDTLAASTGSSASALSGRCRRLRIEC